MLAEFCESLRVSFPHAIIAGMGAPAVAVSAQPVPPEARPNEGALIDILERAMHAFSEWLFFRELRVGTGRQNNGAQHLDAFKLNTLPHRNGACLL